MTAAETGAAWVTALGEDRCTLIADALESINPGDAEATRQARELAQRFRRLAAQFARGE